jgi:antitoxin (DNA-binding transcriptional repressor) of toxin-antitoxin stability system
MQTVELKDAQTRLLEIVQSLLPGEEVVIEKNHQPVARLRSATTRSPRALEQFAGRFRPTPAELKPHDAWPDAE